MRTALLGLAMGWLATGCSQVYRTTDASSLSAIASGLEVAPNGGPTLLIEQGNVTLEPPAGTRFMETSEEWFYAAVPEAQAPYEVRRFVFQGPVEVTTSNGKLCAGQARPPRTRCFEQGDIGAIERTLPPSKAAKAGRIAGIVVGSTLGGAAIITGVAVLISMVPKGNGDLFGMGSWEKAF